MRDGPIEDFMDGPRDLRGAKLLSKFHFQSGKDAKTSSTESQRIFPMIVKAIFHAPIEFGSSGVFFFNPEPQLAVPLCRLAFIGHGMNIWPFAHIYVLY